jgi:hypothetical protein
MLPYLEDTSSYPFSLPGFSFLGSGQHEFAVKRTDAILGFNR